MSTVSTLSRAPAQLNSLQPKPKIKKTTSICQNQQRSNTFVFQPEKTKCHLLNDQEVSLPALVLNTDQLDVNLNWMQSLANNAGLLLCPHGKTTMCPYIFHKQMEGGAWGIALATAEQVRVAYKSGIKRVLMANQLCGRANMRIIAEIMSECPSFEFVCLVDSEKNVEDLANVFGASTVPINVLLEFGYPGGRTGIRSIEQEVRVLEALWKHSEVVRLVGVECYEAMCKTEKEVRALLRHMQSRVITMVENGDFHNQGKPILFSAAGSGWLDIVVEELSAIMKMSEYPVQGVIRPGSYATHEVDTYRAAKCRLSEKLDTTMDTSTLKPALWILTFVQSIPDPGTAIVTIGKRNVDATFDCGFPVPGFVYPRKEIGERWPAASQLPPSSCRITHVMDQHSFLTYDEGEITFQVGDVVVFETPYPGTTMDKYGSVVMVDKDLKVLGNVRTYFYN